MVTTRRGATRLGCLVTLLVGAVALHFGLGFAEAYFRYYRFKDSMAQAARFSADQGDAAIRQRLALAADSLGLPAEARKVAIRRTGGSVALEVRYSEVVKVPGGRRVLHLNPRVEQR